MKKNALISVYHKEGLEDVARLLTAAGWQIFCSDGTARYLQTKELQVKSVAEKTGFANLLSGRVKTLHPAIFAGILARDSVEDEQQLAEYGFEPFTLLMVNFYPFEEALQNRERELNYMVEHIDIGGPSMVRAAAKNFQQRIVVVDPEDYLPVVKELVKEGELSLQRRRQLAQKAFAYTSYYDALIASYLQEEKQFGDYFTIGGKKVMDLRYGENPQQKAALYVSSLNSPFYSQLQLQGKTLSYNNLLDAQTVNQICSEFENCQPFCAIVKHQNPCGAALGETVAEAFQKALATDQQSAFGGIVGFNQQLDRAGAELLAKEFFEVIVAPEFSLEAQEILKKKQNLRLLKLPVKIYAGYELRLLRDAFLLQQSDQQVLSEADLQLQTGEELSAERIRDVLFGWKVLKYVKSNAIVLVKSEQLVGVGAGQMSRVDSVYLALQKAGQRAEGAILLSDGFFPFADSLKIANARGVKIFIEPGGSVRDREVIEFARQNGLTLYFTGKRAFRH